MVCTVRSSNPCGGGREFSYPSRPHLASWKLNTGSLSRWYSDRGVVLTTNPHIMPKLKNRYSYTSTPTPCLHEILHVENFTTYSESSKMQVLLYVTQRRLLRRYRRFERFWCLYLHMKVLLIFVTLVALCNIPGHTNFLRVFCDNLRRSYRYAVLTSESVQEKRVSSISIPHNQRRRIINSQG